MIAGTGGTSKTGKVHHYYKCGNALYKKSCDKKAVKKDWIERLVVTLTRQHILVDDVIKRLDELESKKVDLEISIAREKIEKPPLDKDGDIDDPTYHQAIVDIFVNSVFLYDDELTITYNWKDGTKTVTFPKTR